MVTDNDAPIVAGQPTVRIGGGGYGDEGGEINFTVTVSHATPETVTVEYSTEDLSARAVETSDDDDVISA